MDVRPFVGLISVLLLVLANGFFVATEFAIVAVRRSRLDEAARHGSSAAEAAQDVVAHMDSYLAACQVGITVASLALGWIGEPALAHVIEPPIEALAGAVAPALAHTFSIGLSFFLITTMHIVLGEQAAKGLALQKTEATALFVSPIMRVLYKILRLPIAMLNWLCSALLGLFGLRAAWGEDTAYSAEELRLLVSSSRDAGLVHASEARIASRAFEFADLAAGSLMTPRTELEAVASDVDLDGLVEAAQAASHTRLLVYTRSLDDIIGVVHVRDILKSLQAPRASFSLAGLLRPVLLVPEGKRAHDLLDEMRSSRRHLAVVIEEFGGTAGIVTLRDLVGGLVGRIENEPPVNETLRSVTGTLDGSMVLDGLMRIEEFEEISGIVLNRALNGRAETLGGLVMALLGRIPDIGDKVTLEGRCLEVTERDGMRVASVRVDPPVEAQIAPEEPNGARL